MSIIPSLFDQIEKNKQQIFENETSILLLKNKLKTFKDDKKTDLFEFLKINDEKDLLKKKIAILEMDNQTFDDHNEEVIPRKIIKVLGQAVVDYHEERKNQRIFRRKMLFGVSFAIAATTIFLVRRRRMK